MKTGCHKPPVNVDRGLVLGTPGGSEWPFHIWISAHLMAFQFVRMILSCRLVFFHGLLFLRVLLCNNIRIASSPFSSYTFQERTDQCTRWLHCPLEELSVFQHSTTLATGGLLVALGVRIQFS